MCVWVSGCVSVCESESRRWQQNMLSASLAQKLTAYRANLWPARLQAVYCTCPDRQRGRQTNRQTGWMTSPESTQTGKIDLVLSSASASVCLPHNDLINPFRRDREPQGSKYRRSKAHCLPFCRSCLSPADIIIDASRRVVHSA